MTAVLLNCDTGTVRFWVVGVLEVKFWTLLFLCDIILTFLPTNINIKQDRVFIYIYVKLFFITISSCYRHPQSYTPIDWIGMSCTAFKLFVLVSYWLVLCHAGRLVHIVYLSIFRTVLQLIRINWSLKSLKIPMLMKIITSQMFSWYH